MSSMQKQTRISSVSNGKSENASAACASASPPLHLLREVMRERGLSAYLVEAQDAHQNDYNVADHDKRREWLTGFMGSKGTALVTSSKALLWTGGRYFLQVRCCARYCCVVMQTCCTGQRCGCSVFLQPGTTANDGGLRSPAVLVNVFLPRVIPGYARFVQLFERVGIREDSNSAGGQFQDQRSRSFCTKYKMLEGPSRPRCCRPSFEHDGSVLVLDSTLLAA